jgi:hypothetical protein
MSTYSTNQNNHMIITTEENVTRRPDGSPLQLGDAWIDLQTLEIKRRVGFESFRWQVHEGPAVAVTGSSSAVVLSASQKLPFNVKEVDNFGEWSNANAEFTCVEGGRYIITMHIVTNGGNMSGLSNRPALWYGETEGQVINVDIQNSVGFYTTVASFLTGEKFSVRMASTLVGTLSVDMQDSNLTIDRLF